MNIYIYIWPGGIDHRVDDPRRVALDVGGLLPSDEPRGGRHSNTNNNDNMINNKHNDNSRLRTGRSGKRSQIPEFRS